MKRCLIAVLSECLLAGATAYAGTHTVNALTDLAGVNNALRVKTGDTVSLPALSEGAYKVTNARYAKLGQDGTTLTILEPGMLGVQQLAADGTSIVTTGAILVVPDAIGDGRVFVWNPTHWDSANWCTSESPVWTIVEGEGSASDYPHLPNDIAILPRYGDWDYEINISQDISLGGLMMGSYMLDKDMEPYRFTLRSDGATAHTLAFQRTDGESAWIRICPNGNSTGDTYYRIRPTFGQNDRPLVVRCQSDVELDLGWDGSSPNATTARVHFREGSTLAIDAGRTLTVTHGSPYQNGGYFATVEVQGTVTGSGTLANRGRAAVLFEPDASTFTGRIVEAGGGRNGYDRSAQTFFRNSDTLDSTTLEIEGFVVRTDYRTFPPASAAGYARIGSDHTWPGQEEIGNRLPGAAVILHGGKLELQRELKTWSEGAKLRYETDLISVSNGFSHVTAIGPGNDQSFPPMIFSAQDGEHANSATMYLRCNHFWINHGEYTDKAEVLFPWFKDFAIGGVVPWITGHEHHPDYGDWMAMRFPQADENGYLYMPVYASGDLAGFAAGANACCNGNSLRLTDDLTVNSLSAQNSWGGDKRIGAGRTLTITSGGLILNGGNTRIGENDWNQTEPAADCGTIAFGNTAYVWANSPDENNANDIFAKIVAPYGFVCAYPGYLHLVGDQTGIDGEIVVNAGELTLGTGRNMNGVNLDLGCTIDVPVRLVGGGAKLIVRKAGTLVADLPIYFDDVGGYAGKIDLPAGVTETCEKAYVRNSAQSADWATLPRGTYGSSAAAAANLGTDVIIDDDHFTGTGLLEVRRDDLAIHKCTTILVR